MSYVSVYVVLRRQINFCIIDSTCNKLTKKVISIKFLLEEKVSKTIINIKEIHYDTPSILLLFRDINSITCQARIGFLPTYKIYKFKLLF